ncbi:Putative flippase GtrA (transmembrane translocase of bactoprenol-linked glucose) [Rhodococcus erythropolis]|uniref:Flippase GtrA (Transmembrane translocase of bactoprenol-linked glucose) n=1 Tax=Rhodococcus erythropolis TaxID=1833 RepID=A0A401MYY9_RHOER|nr:Putative flippase GtrA (transmembrane translocase of bactoprenol-linked glucose) [Rhodococcus erythropolis]BCF80685.1 hypothetical protein RQCS_02300 [Rhodococcus qingshengii]GCB53827.1 hypothetical protein rerp_02350 [Rhodococcus erythropolis]SCZ12919.1 Putative flippase GtrA (transmembrane translocase of bactoprenol-linked glucose) [Rhodococcus erythropolis]
MPTAPTRVVTLVVVPETPASHQHEPHVPLPVEIPVTTDIADDAMDLKTQIVRFVATGGLSAVVDYGLYAFLFKVVGLDLSVAKSISFIAGTTTAYLINRRWTFKAEPSRARFIAVVVLYAVTFAVQVGLNALMVHVLADEWWRMPLAFVIAQGTATVINFIVQRAVIFKIK